MPNYLCFSHRAIVKVTKGRTYLCCYCIGVRVFAWSLQNEQNECCELCHFFRRYCGLLLISEDWFLLSEGFRRGLRNVRNALYVFW